MRNLPIAVVGYLKVRKKVTQQVLTLGTSPVLTVVNLFWYARVSLVWATADGRYIGTVSI